MTPEEHDLIAGLFERMRGMGTIEKDREAEDFIARSARQVPDAAYMLVQSVLVQEHALQEAGAKIEDLEQQLRERDRDQDRRPATSGGFVGGIFGGRDAPEARGRGSVPSIGSRAAAPQSGEPGASWAQRSRSFGDEPQRGGGFLRGAMATAAGVAGGMLLADSIRGMLGGDAGKAQAASGQDKAQPETGQDQPKEEAEHQDTNDHDAANYEDASSWGDFGGSDDFEI